MNPFLKDPVATPLEAKHLGGWRSSTFNGRAHTLSRRASAVAMVAGLAVGLPAQAIDVNVASVSQLESLRGVGPRTAKLIVHERARAGAFTSMEDLSDRVRGLGERRVRALQAAGLEVRASARGQSSDALSPNVSLTTPKKSRGGTPSSVAKPEIISPPQF